MRDPRIIKIENQHFLELKKAIEESKAAALRAAELVQTITSISEWRKFSLNTKYESAGFYLYEEITCQCGRIHEDGDPPPISCLLNMMQNMQPHAVVNIGEMTGAAVDIGDQILPGELPIKKH